ncbi:MAG: N-6 DNA methylase [Gracilimonas sp.]|uniref:Eco57I restriction-modification methylase domain-containing protein n=1 Tax=Gracilimonas sp. TaxID=1974203 RepID=UPI001B2027D4|nr:N-6 DNA methylase [Gracilimonas sp.]MBO6586782.1 N-6 DNA methylase [Gracilimonas sp.]MBO6615439.1 N-6 DNA methylase [Gracilimonas sp.]
MDNEVIAGLTDGALISYYQPETNEWRITFYSERYGWDEDGNTIKEETHPKRYTYVVGPAESCKTAAGRLIKVVQKGDDNNLEHVLEAFSVQKVSKEFFKEYKEQYDKFVGHLTGKIWTKSGVKEVGDRISQFQFYFKATTDHEKEARDFVKKLLGRIVFLYFVQKKQWLGAKSTDFNDGKPDFIYDLFKQVPEDKKDQFYSQWLTKLFFDTLNRDDDHAFEMPDGSTVYIPFLNGGLFEKDETDHNTETLLLPGELFSNPEDSESPNTRGFLDFLSAYNFTIHEDSPGDHTIAVDPEMLGHIFENLLEDNKDKGAYYTPKPIVHYMCQESLIEYLLTELTAEDTEDSEKDELRCHLEDLIKKQEAGDLVGFTEQLLKSLKEVKVCDPAIGSGAFPMGILQEIYQAVETLHHLSPDNVQAIWELPDEDWHPAEVKKQIIQNSIYGVDIEKGAVDIARLRFWLSLIVDEEKPTALPNLDYKIVVGDSLVSRLVIDGEEQIVNINWEMEGEVDSTKEHLQNLKKALSAIVDKQEKYFDADTEEKENLKKEIDQHKVEALIHQLHFDREDYVANNEDKGNLFEENTERKLKLIGFNDLIKKLESLRKTPSSIHYFDWKLDFPEMLNEKFTKQTGFDIVIANPPYLGESGNKEKFRRVQLGGLSNFYLGKMDYFYFFMHLALNLSNEKGINTFITTNYYPTADGALKLRNDLKDRSSILQLINFGELKIFDSARGQHNLITIFKKPAAKDISVQIIDVKKNGTGSTNELNKILSNKDEQTEYRSFKSIDLYDGSKNYIRLSGTTSYSDSVGVNGVLEKILDKSDDLLGNITEINQGVVSGCDKFTNRFTEKVESLSKIAINDGIYVFDLENVRDLQTIKSFNSDEKELLKPFFKNSDIDKYQSRIENDKLLLYLDRNVNSIENYPNIERHLMRFEGILKDRREYKNGRIKYFQLQWPRDENIFKSPKICVPYRVKDNCFAYNEIDWYCRSDCYLITHKNDHEDVQLKYLLALINSSLFFFWLYHRGKRKGETLELFYTPLSEIPIYLAHEKIQAELIEKVEKIERLRSDGQNTTALEQQIDTLVYKLYNLTWEEVQVVDPEFGLSEEEYEAVSLEND